MTAITSMVDMTSSQTQRPIFAAAPYEYLSTASTVPNATAAWNPLAPYQFNGAKVPLTFSDSLV